MPSGLSVVALPAPTSTVQSRTTAESLPSRSSVDAFPAPTSTVQSPWSKSLACRSLRVCGLTVIDPPLSLRLIVLGITCFCLASWNRWGTGSCEYLATARTKCHSLTSTTIAMDLSWDSTLCIRWVYSAEYAFLPRTHPNYNLRRDASKWW